MAEHAESGEKPLSVFLNDFNVLVPDREFTRDDLQRPEEAAEIIHRCLRAATTLEDGEVSEVARLLLEEAATYPVNPAVTKPPRRLTSSGQLLVAGTLVAFATQKDISRLPEADQNQIRIIAHQKFLHGAGEREWTVAMASVYAGAMQRSDFHAD